MNYICKICGKEVPYSRLFGSGKFCSRSCANRRIITDETKNKIKNTLVKHEECFCAYCDRKFDTKIGLITHEKFCINNPTMIINRGALQQHKKYINSKYKTKQGEELDVTNKEICDYLEKNKTCEICGKTIERARKYEGKNAPKRLCIDHDHKTHHFRGVLCSTCNRQLGWYEANQENIEKYLKK